MRNAIVVCTVIFSLLVNHCPAKAMDDLLDQMNPASPFNPTINRILSDSSSHGAYNSDSHGTPLTATALAQMFFSMGALASGITLSTYYCHSMVCALTSIGGGIIGAIAVSVGIAHASKGQNAVNLSVNISPEAFTRFKSQLLVDETNLLTRIIGDQESGYSMSEIFEHMTAEERISMNRIAKHAQDSGIQISLQ